MYEHRHSPLLSRRKFTQRMASHGLFALGVIALSLMIGVLGYHFLDNQSWVDALLNASMILGGMGPIDTQFTGGIPAKLFASFYALFSGLVLVGSFGILTFPIVHRLLHHFHLDSPT